MLSNADNALLTDTDAGTPMGELFRRFWLPVALSEDLPTRDCPPLRLRIMGEDLVAFRATDGNIGLVCGYCPHRGAPLFFGRNEENGLRCVYHGWKFDILGRCIDLPNSPEGQSVKSRVSVRSYPCVEAADLVWAYLGPADKRPPFPEFEWIRLPKTHRYVRKHYLQCNYMQSMEGDFDPSHGAFLHMTLDDMRKTPTHALGRLTNTNNASKGKWLTNPRVFGTLEDTENAVLCLTDAELEDGKTIATAAPIWLMPYSPLAQLRERTSNPGIFASQ